MSPLRNLPGISKTALELLEVAGFCDARALADANVEKLTRELERANSVFKIAKDAPNPQDVSRWIETARQLVGETVAPATVAMPAVKLTALMESAPYAIPLPHRVLVENNLGVADVPLGILFEPDGSEMDFRSDDRRLPRVRPQHISSGHPPAAEHSTGRLEIDISKLRSTENLGEPPVVGAPGQPSPENERVTLMRSPRSETNKGRDPKSRWYIRGVLHNHPVAIYLGALVTLLIVLWVPASLVSTTLLLLSAESPRYFGWVPSWLLWFPVTLPLFGIGYLIWGLSGRCRICGQKLFMHRVHLKNAKAHHVRGLGYVLPLCMQILIFRWFRCSHCGTPVRLKE